MTSILISRGDRELITHLALRELRSRYKRTALGWGWSMLNPLLTAVIYSFVFGQFLKIKPSVGDPSGLHNFTLFLLAGLLPWNLIGSGLPAAMGALVGNAGLVKKVRFRRDSLVIASVAAAGVTLLIELFVLGTMMLVLGHRSALPFIPAIVGLVVLESLFVLGIGLVLAAANVYFRDLQYLTNIGLMAWMYLSPLLYPITFVPVHGRVFGHRLPLRFLLRLNPMARFLGAFRETMYDLRYPSLKTWLSLVASAAFVLWIGFAVFHRLQGRFAEEL